MSACIVVIATGLGAIRYGYKKVSWREMVPTTLLIFLMPNLEKSNTELYNQLKYRMDSDEIEGWQWEWMFDWCTNDLSQSPLVSIYARPVWNVDDPVEYLVKFNGLQTGVTWVDEACFDLELAFKGISDKKHGRTGAFENDRVSPSKLIGNAKVFSSKVSATENQELIFDVEVEFQNDLGSAFAGKSNLYAGYTYLTTTCSGQVVIPNSVRHYLGNYSGPKIKRSYRLRIPIQFAGSNEGMVNSSSESSLLKQIRDHTQVVYAESDVYLKTDSRAWGEPEGITLALKIEFIYQGTVTALSRVYLDIDGTNSSNIGLLSKSKLNYKSLIDGSEEDWSVRISGDDVMPWYVLETHFKWGGEFELPMRVKIEAGKPVPIWSAEDEQTIADLDEG